MRVIFPVVALRLPPANGWDPFGVVQLELFPFFLSSGGLPAGYFFGLTSVLALRPTRIDKV